VRGRFVDFYVIIFRWSKPPHQDKVNLVGEVGAGMASLSRCIYLSDGKLFQTRMGVGIHGDTKYTDYRYKREFAYNFFRGKKRIE
jgi:hypothetical protein